ncbi:aminotransferase class I/II-fold pyridoxal phosphate-dependent enzyme [Evansella sp. AB-rgal1]|uniref:aminotransferase class I/II-fold pyridoxal phosphate-dependent enzyme n=1 Tax=Evansella sp. AB-rgal1 TaxID=3242696 RepID=UPI00359CBB0D
MDQSKTPLFDQLVKHHKKETTSFHVPGHKNGTVFFQRAKKIYQEILQLDVTEISGMDDLHHPSGVIKEAEELTADLYGVESSHFLIGGSTVGNLAMIMSSVSKGDKILVQRNCHQSVFHGIELSGATPIFIEPEIDKETGFSLGISKGSLQEAIQSIPDIKVLVLTSPTYEGYGQPLHEQIKIAHEANIVVFVDEAHGAHLLTDDPRWPVSATKAGADIVVQSAHKMLPAMTMTSYLHVNSRRVNKDRLLYYLKMLQSSSPSYPLLASLDVARAYAAQMIKQGYGPLTEAMGVFKRELREQGLLLAPSKIGDYVQDPLKLVFISSDYSAKRWQCELEKREIYPELVSPYHVLLTLPLSNDVLPFAEWKKELVLCLSDDKSGKMKQRVQVKRNILSTLEYPMGDLDSFVKRNVSWEKAVGEIAAETITPYPPGVPLIVKGERIKIHHIEELERYLQNNAYFQTGDEWKEKGILVVN